MGDQARRGSYTNRDGDEDRDANADRDTDGHADGDAHRHAYGYPNSYAYGDAYRNPNGDAYCDANGHAYCNGDRDSDGYRDFDADGDANGHGHRHTQSVGDADRRNCSDELQLRLGGRNCIEQDENVHSQQQEPDSGTSGIGYSVALVPGSSVHYYRRHLLGRQNAGAEGQAEQHLHHDCGLQSDGHRAGE